MEKSRAIELLEHLAWDRDIERNCYGEALQIAIDTLKQPEIITCGKCIHRCVDGSNNCCVLNDIYAQPDDWYCADAERRTE